MRSAWSAALVIHADTLTPSASAASMTCSCTSGSRRSGHWTWATTNLVLAQQNLVFKQRNGAKITKRYDRAATPAERVNAHETTTQDCRAKLRVAMAAVRLGERYRQIATLTGQLENLALAKAPAPVKPRSTESSTHEPGGGNT
ncbi:MAG: hypothetical protein ACRDRT_15335 [Pseudonocardiaceae bacterium]